MSFNTALDRAFEVWYDSDNTEESAVTYSGVSVEAQLRRGDHLDDDGNYMYAYAELDIQKSDVASPTYRDVVVIGSETWYVRRILKDSPKDWTLEIHRDERINQQ